MGTTSSNKSQMIDASLGSRVMAFVLDCGICTATLVFILVCITWIESELGYPDGRGLPHTVDTLMTYAIRGLVILGTILYFTVFDGTALRSTFGKRMAGIQVVRTDGRGSIGFFPALMRTLIKLGSIFSGIGAIIQLIAIQSSKESRGLHDLASNSRVVVAEAS